jgi:V8-like Glu-specific endopeptidase
MLDVIVALLIGAAQAQDAEPKTAPLPKCNLTSRLNGPGDPLLERLKGAAAFSCSASLVTLKGRAKTEKGLILTSGHCVRRGQATIHGRTMVPAPGEVLVRIKEERTFALDTGNAAAPRACVNADELVYATLTQLDVAIYQLTETYEEIEQRTGASAFTIAADAQIPAGLAVRLPSAFHQNNYPCSTDRTIPKLKEGMWTWGPVLRLTKACDAPPGGSGSPVIREDTNEVIGVFGTVYDADGPACDIMNPCEIDENGAASVADKGQPYAHFVHGLYACLDARGNIDLGVAGCMLPKP